jgi:Ca-activated chloride channel homolog
MDERQLQEILNSEKISSASEDAYERAVAHSLSAFDSAQQENHQGISLISRLKGRINFQSRRRFMTRQFAFGGMATAIAVVLAVFTYNTMNPFLSPQMHLSQSTPKEAEAKRKIKQNASSTRNRQNYSSKEEATATVRKPAGLAFELVAPSRQRKVYERRAQSLPPNVRGKLIDRKENQINSMPPKPSSGRLQAVYPPADTQVIKEVVGRDRFEEVEQNTIKRVLDDPVSTFSIDVDTSSYSFIRRKLTSGVLPQKNAVRIEELINYFDYGYPQPKDREEPFQPTVTVSPSPWKPGNKLIHIGVKGYDIEDAENPRSNLVFLLDVSGSMNATDKLPLMVNSMKLLLGALSPDDRVAIVVYAGAAGTVLEPTKISEKHKIIAALDNLRSGGSTAGGEGIRQAYALAEAQFDKNAVNRVILATDGDFNVGIIDRNELKGFIERKRETGIFLSVLGFGTGNLNDQLMQSLAQNGNGMAAHIDTLNEARKVLVEEASSTLFPIAKDVKIQVEFNPDVVAEYRLIGYETRALNREDFRNDKVDAGDIGAGHTVTAIYEITPVESDNEIIGKSRYKQDMPTPQSTKSFSGEYGFLKIRYKLPNEDKSKLLSTAIRVSHEIGSSASETTAQQLRDTRWATAISAFGQILKGGKYTGEYSYDDVIALAKTAKGEDEFGYRAEFINLVRLARSAAALPRN